MRQSNRAGRGVVRLMDRAAIPRLVPKLFKVVATLIVAALGQHFTPDGHLVDSTGEVIAAFDMG